MNIHPRYHTLRIALTQDGLPSGALLPFEKIRIAAKAAADCGVRRFELAGGEPLAREDLPVLLMMLSSVCVVEDMTLTTDGLLLPRWAKSIRGGGVQRVIVKLDTFDPGKYRRITGGGDFGAVLAGIRALMEVGFPPATLEVRLMRGVNDDELPSLARLTQMTGVSLRLMELTQAEAEAIRPGAQMTCEQALSLIPGLVQEKESIFRLPGAQGTITLVPSAARESGCLVLSADGILRLGSHEADIRTANEDEILSIIREVISK